MNLQIRFLAAFLSVSLIGILVVLAAAAEISEAASETEALHGKVVLPLEDLLTITETFHRIRVNIRDLADAGTPADREAAEATIAALEAREAQAAADLSARLLTGRSRQLYLQYIEARTRYSDNLRHMEASFLAGRSAEGRAVLTGAGKTNALAVQDALNQLTESREGVAVESSDSRRAAVFTFVGLSAAAVLISVFLAFLISRTIARSVRATVSALDALADFRWPELSDAALNRTDELGAMVRAVRRYAQTWALSQEAVKGASNRLRIASLELDQVTVDSEAVAIKLRKDIASIAAAVSVHSGATLRVAAGANTALQAAELLNRSLAEEEGVQRALARSLGEGLILGRRLAEALGPSAEDREVSALAATLRSQLESLERQNSASVRKFEHLFQSSKDLLQGTRAIDHELSQLLTSSRSIEEASGGLESASFQVTDSAAIARQAVSETQELAADLSGLVREVRMDEGPAGT